MRFLVPSLVAATLLLAPPPPAAAARSGCAKAASVAAKACKVGAKADLLLEKGKCLQGEASQARDCQDDAKEESRETRDECKEIREARGDLCEELGEDTYAPALDPADFVAVIDNPFAPFAPGSRWVYEKETDEGTERIEVEVQVETRTIQGIEATIVRDVVFLDDVLVEDTFDWLAQDQKGNVWYLGEIAQNYEDGNLVDVEGSWEYGRDGAQPGLWMKAAPAVGDVYRQELLLGEAEDVGRVVTLDADVDVPAGSFAGCLGTEDLTPLEPDALENKFYAPGVGLVLEVDPETGERTELVEVTLP